jgi:hypothetical protein
LLCLLIVLIVLPTLAVPAHAASADLTVDNVWLEKASSPDQPVASVAPGEQFNIVASVKNIGDSAGSGYYLDVYYDSDYGRGGPDNIAAGEVQVWYVGPLTAQSGSHTTKWIVDPDKQIAESNYDNNEKDLTFTIGSETTNTTTTTTSTTASNSTITSTTQTTTTANSTGTSTSSSTQSTSTSTSATESAGSTTTTMTSSTSSTMDSTSTQELAQYRAGISQPYILGFKVSNTHSGIGNEDYYYSTTGWSATPASFSVTLADGESIFLIATSQLWNDYSTIGSSIAITRDGARISGDMFAAGATMTSRELGVAVAVDTPGAGTFTYALSAKTDPGGMVWVSQPHLLGFRVSDVYSSSALGDYAYSSTYWSPGPASLQVTLAEGESLFLIGTAQVWNDYSTIGSSIAICRDDLRVSGDMFAAGATIANRELAMAVAVDSPGAGTWTYALSAKTDPGGRAWISQPYLLGFKVSTVYSSSVTGDYYYSSTDWSATDASLPVTLASGESLFLIATAQVWNDNPIGGSRIAICRDGVRVSTDMFAAGATITVRELAVVIALSTPGAGTWTYLLSAKTD